MRLRIVRNVAREDRERCIVVRSCRGIRALCERGARQLAARERDVDALRRIVDEESLQRLLQQRLGLRIPMRFAQRRSERKPIVRQRRVIGRERARADIVRLGQMLRNRYSSPRLYSAVAACRLSAPNTRCLVASTCSNSVRASSFLPRPCNTVASVFAADAVCDASLP